MVLCGHCKMPHDSVEAVKACSQTKTSSGVHGYGSSKGTQPSNDEREGSALPRNSTGRGYGSQAQDERALRKTAWAYNNPSKLMTPTQLSKWLEENKYQ